jgi:hypothetical protein
MFENIIKYIQFAASIILDLGPRNNDMTMNGYRSFVEVRFSDG